MGPHLTFHLVGGNGGMAHFLDQLGSPLETGGIISARRARPPRSGRRLPPVLRRRRRGATLRHSPPSATAFCSICVPSSGAVPPSPLSGEAAAAARLARRRALTGGHAGWSSRSQLSSLSLEGPPRMEGMPRPQGYRCRFADKAEVGRLPLPYHDAIAEETRFFGAEWRRRRGRKGSSPTMVRTRIDCPCALNRFVTFCNTS